MPRFSTVLATSFLAASAAAHFTVTSPKVLGNDTEKEDISPCGSYTADLSDGSSQLNDFHVSGEPLIVKSSHAQADWLIRGTLDSSASKDWVELIPIFSQTGVGTWCMEVIVPRNWTGEKGIVGIVGSGGDGNLFACMAANFVNGTATSNSACTNSSGVTIATASDSALEALLGTPSNSSTNSTSGSDDSKDAASLLSATPLAGLVSIAAVIGAMIAL